MLHVILYSFLLATKITNCLYNYTLCVKLHTPFLSSSLNANLSQLLPTRGDNLWSNWQLTPCTKLRSLWQWKCLVVICVVWREIHFVALLCRTKINPKIMSEEQKDKYVVEICTFNIFKNYLIYITKKNSWDLESWSAFWQTSLKVDYIKQKKNNHEII